VQMRQITECVCVCVCICVCMSVCESECVGMYVCVPTTRVGGYIREGVCVCVCVCVVGAAHTHVCGQLKHLPEPVDVPDSPHEARSTAERGVRD
jgi:hypothetical protein